MSQNRRQPKQQRAKFMVEIILDATLKCVGEQGFDQTTTRHIAEAAGISIGSLYQYYKNKNEIYDALQKRLLKELEVFMTQQSDLLALSFADAFRTLILRALKLMESDGGGRLAFARQLRNLDSANGSSAAEKLARQLFTLFALRHPPLAQVGDLQVLSMVLFHTGAANLLRYLDEPVPNMTLEQFLDHLMPMLLYYIKLQLPPGADDSFLGI